MNRLVNYSRRLMWFFAFLMAAFVTGYGTGFVSTLVDPINFSVEQPHSLLTEEGSR